MANNSNQTKIKIRGARVHNLKGIDVDIPKNKLVVITGLSGSGKSSLAFDTIYAEGQRRYVESLSSYARQFLGLADKPDLDQIEGLSPTIAISQKAISNNPRSTVGTITEIYDYLRLLFARIGHPHCPKCGQPVSKQSINQIINKIFKLPKGTEIIIAAPLVRGKRGEHKHILEEIKKAGFVRVRFDGELMFLEEAEDLTIDKQKKHNLEVVVDQLKIDAREQTRLTESLAAALDLGNGLVMACPVQNSGGVNNILFNQHFACQKCDINLPEIEPRSFSFNSPYGACSECSGLGHKLKVDPDLVVPNKKLTLAQGAIRPWSRTFANQSWQVNGLQKLAETYLFSLNAPFEELSKEAGELVFYGDKQGRVDFEGVIPNLERRWRETDSDYIRSEIERYMRVQICPLCRGKRLRDEVLAVTVGGQNIADVTALDIEKVSQFFKNLPRSLSDREQTIGRQILQEIISRLAFLKNVGLDYLALDRSATTLSGGEAQRIRLATQIGSALSGVIYVLDEPTIGLHQRDNQRLIDTLKALRDLGNTVIVVEHDAETILAADYVIDIGPGAGEHGGQIIATGTPSEIKKNKRSLTGLYLAGAETVPIPKKYRKGNNKEIKILGAEEHNLKKINVNIPLASFVCFTGVSGSGKSTLMIDILARALAQKFYRAKDLPGKHKEIRGIEHIDKVIHIDQSPIGRTPRSNPATYTGVFTPIRDLYTEAPEAKIRGYKAGQFSFNVRGGRCEVCSGDGMVKIEMQLLPDVYMECEACRGKRYNKEALEIHYQSKTIADVLEMTVEEARYFFEKIPVIYDKLNTLFEVGLGYIKLGQPATTLSGGEAQRVKLATELSRRATGKTLYILDEPTTGLHFDDTRRLLKVLNALVDKGNTVLVIEHNPDVIKCADYVIDLGPEGGDKGGEVVAKGTPREVAKNTKSYTGQYLRKIISNI